MPPKKPMVPKRKRTALQELLAPTWLEQMARRRDSGPTTQPPALTPRNRPKSPPTVPYAYEHPGRANKKT